MVAAVGAVVGCGLELGMAVGDCIEVDAEAAGAGAAALGIAIGVGTETIGSAPEEVGADSGLAASEGTGADAISAVPAP